MEIERKFLVKHLPELKNLQFKCIEQAYLEIGKREKRIRKTNKGCFVTIKSGKGLAREEKEHSIPQDEYDKLIDKHIGNIIKKKRYLIPIGEDLTAELDIYEDDLARLKIVEVEFSSIEQAMGFCPPVWFGKDVTENGAYKNSSLALNGLSKIENQY